MTRLCLLPRLRFAMVNCMASRPCTTIAFHAPAFLASAPTVIPRRPHVSLTDRRPRLLATLPTPSPPSSRSVLSQPTLNTLSSLSSSSNQRSLCTPAATGSDHHDEQQLPGAPPIREEDLEESFVRGSGPGGQKINKTSVCVVIKHIPSGIVIKCQESRSQTKNRDLARKILQRKLDEQILGELSDAAREASRARARKAKRRRKSVTKHFKSRRDRMLLE